MDTIKETDTVIIRSVDEKCCYILKVNGEQKLGKSRIRLKNLVGKPYGSVFELIDRQLVLVDKTENFTEYEVEAEAAESEKGNNSTYVDTNTAQKLTDAEIKELKASGKSGGEIIQTLINNSDTFATKTDYAQEKWIKRKEKKYRTMYRVLKSEPYNICACSFDKNREKVCGMRPDSLAQVIAQSGVRSGSRVLIFESMTGLIVGSVAYRLRGNGRILTVYGSQQPHLEMVHHFNLDEASTNIIQAVPSGEVGPAAEDVCSTGFQKITYEACDEPASKKLKVETTDGSSSSSSAVAAGTEGVVTTNSRGARPRGSSMNNSGRGKEGQARVRKYLREGADSLIIASRYSPLPILKQALYLLAPASPFVLYCEFMEPLVDCFLYLQQSGMALKLVLSDTWAREYQTLPGRVRPDMFMSTSGGYILSGIYVGMLPREYKGDC